ncbi:Clp amino terminal domain-containing protein [Schinkia azotoformans MEV2011]|uniref:Clp amino terminal domain-containing protein n=1 Tax=Schinkia azotoformans MEV2011 TaxID=1348973 RepID=A0A072NN19_SCHAZ|nr:Clp amino terminal domain-containing protein [Schinkia azotoformans MEV2011]
MDMNKMTEKTQEALVNSQSLAVRKGHQQVDVEHVFSSLLTQEDGITTSILQKLNINPGTVQKLVEEALNKLPKVSGSGVESGAVYITQRLQSLLVRAEDEASRLKDEYISVEHLILAMTDEKQTTEIAKIFQQIGFDRASLLKVLTEVRGNQRVTSPTPEVTYDALKKYGRDLVEDVKKGKIDPVIGRDAEIRRLFGFYQGRQKITQS